MSNWKGTVAEKCFFCNKEGATTKNNQGLITCSACKTKEYHADRCPICKGFLEEKNGKYGAYYICGMHGNWNAKRLKALTR